MQRLQLAGGIPFTTGDELADALFEHLHALSTFHLHGAVRVPVIAEDGRRTWWTALLGPSSQLSAIDVTDLPELEDPDTAEDLRIRTARIRGESADPLPASWFVYGGGSE